jgi:predicted nucleotidyltransferase
MGIPRDLIRDEAGIGEWAILHAYRGSIAHGMYVPSSDPTSIDDKDTMAICVPPVDHYYGLAEYGSRGTREIKRGEWDIVVYEARKAVRLLAQGNPNVLSILWLPESMYIAHTDAGRLLVANRDAFVGRHVYRSFVGYATAQLRKMESGVFNGYMGNKRRALVETHGYDTKNAAHLIRLLRMGIEFLRDGDLIVDRGSYDATELLAIKRGEWTLDKVKDEAARLFRRAEEVHDHSTLPAKPDRERVEELCVEVVHHALDGRARSRLPFNPGMLVA